MQTITDDLQDILKAKFQAAAQGFRARVVVITEGEEVIACPLVVGTIVSSSFTSGESFDAAPPATYQAPAPEVDSLVYMVAGYRRADFIGAGLALVPHGWTEIEMEDNVPYESAHDMFIAGWAHVAAGDDPPLWEIAPLTSGFIDVWSVCGVAVPTEQTTVLQLSTNPTTPNVPVEFNSPPAAGNVLIGLVGGSNSNDAALGDTAEWHLIITQAHDNGSIGTAFTGVYYHCVTQAEEDAGKTAFGQLGNAFGSAGWCVALECQVTQSSLHEEEQRRPKRVSIDKSLRLVADAAEVEFENEDIGLGWGPTDILQTNQRIAIDQWYGADGNAIRTFTGLVDRVSDHRDVLTQTWTCRDLMALLVDQNFSASAPQGADEDGAVRTEANGVFLNREVSYIVSAILDAVGWPTADRDIADTSYVLDEFIISDGESYSAALIGDEKLTGLVGYSAWADELGVFHFAPTLVSQNLTDPQPLDYTFRSGEDIVSLDDEVDQYDLVTRIKVRGPLTTTTLTDTWRELWRTSKIRYPVGIWYDPTDSAYIRVIDRETKRLYRLRQSDRVIVSSVYLGSVIPHPLGLSGDPADSSIYWVLNAPWIHGGSGGNQVVKMRKSDNHVIARYSIPSGRWSALKVSSSYLYLTNLDTDRFYRRSKANASAIANYSHTYNAVVQANPSGIMIDGTSLYLFWANGGTTARFLKCDESAPGTVTDVVKTAGTTLHGGEMDTTTHTECWGDSDSLGLVAKFTLVAAVDQTNEVSAEVVDIDLEDELGQLALVENREHDAHPSDPDHRWEARRTTLDLTVITSLAQATETAQRQLDILSQRRRVLDAGIVGNPQLQKTDYVAVVDPITGVSSGFAIDTYRTEMNEGTYLGTMALLPVEDITDTPDEDPDAEEGGDVELALIDRTATATAVTVS